MAVLATYKGGTMQTVRQQRTSQTLRKKAVVVFAVLLLVALQFTNATHQFAHTANDLGDVCAFCLQLDRLDDSDTAGSATAVLRNANSDYDEFTPSLMLVSRRIFSQPRAPPLS